MIWIVFGAMAVATFLAVGQILVDANPRHARRQIRGAAIAIWAAGFILTLAGKPVYGLVLMALGALGVFAAPRPERSRVFEGDRDRWSADRGPDLERDRNPGAFEDGFGATVVTEQHAYQILGLQPGATLEEIGSAHRALMKKFHPDQGGSTELAARVNAAKDVLTKRRHS